MRFVISQDDHLELQNPREFTAFSIAAANPVAAEVLRVMGEQAGAAEEDDHVFVSVAAVRSMAGTEVDAEWEDGLAKMMAFAGKNGWLSPSGDAIKAHIEQL